MRRKDGDRAAVLLELDDDVLPPHSGVFDPLETRNVPHAVTDRALHELGHFTPIDTLAELAVGQQQEADFLHR